MFPPLKDQLYVFVFVEIAPFKLSVSPSQIVSLSAIRFALGALSSTIIVMLASFEQLPVVPVTLYVVVPDGVTTGFELLLLVKLVAGVQRYELAPLTLRFEDPPGQIVVCEAETLSVGVASTLTTNEST